MVNVDRRMSVLVRVVVSIGLALLSGACSSEDEPVTTATGEDVVVSDDAGADGVDGTDGAMDDVGEMDDTSASDDAGTDAADGANGGDDVVGPDDGGGADSNEDTGATDDVGDVEPLPVTCVDIDGQFNPNGGAWSHGGKTATVTTNDNTACYRTYVLSTDESLQDGLPGNPRTVPEVEGAPTIRTGHELFDALHALALEEVVECSVEQVNDGGFNNGASVPCGEGGCFETGRKWNYVWTRDTAYAVDLGLAAMDPTRSRNSLRFKLSPRRGGNTLQIVQDTGSGGSWPVSTDRVSWVVGAWATLAQLDGDAATSFRNDVRESVIETVEYDRIHVYDSDLGLYRGEQSFLDWREQSYPVWTADDTSDIAMSMALSTNVLHLRALEVAAALSVNPVQTTKFQGWADDLRTAINDQLWLAADGMYSTFVTTTLDPTAARRFDLLGLSLAVIHGVADETQAASILSKYPHYGLGAPVMWPQQQDVPIYHNRGEWPFVTAYWLRAAAAVGNDAVGDRMMAALVRGAALNLSNMENFEAGSGANWLDDGPASGPVVNSQRQLWSVAGYLSMVHHTLFGVHSRFQALGAKKEVEIAPFVSRNLRRTWFGGTDTLVLNDMPVAGKTLTVVLHLPEDTSTEGGVYVVGEVQLDGETMPNAIFDVSSLPAASRVDVTLEIDPQSVAGTLTEVSDADYRMVFGPRNPTISNVGGAEGGIELTIVPPADPAEDITMTVYRDGVVVADELPGDTTSWVDTSADPATTRGLCYTVEAVFTVSGNRSQHARPQCFWGPGFGLIQSVDAQSFVTVGGQLVNNHGRWHYEGWGESGHSITAAGFTAQHTGRHLVQVDYGNGSGPINTGITCAVKWVKVVDSSTGATAGEGMIAMPQLASWTRWVGSTFVAVPLVAGTTYDIVIESDPDVYNMSELEHFEVYTGGEGGVNGAWNYVNISDVKLLPW